MKTTNIHRKNPVKIFNISLSLLPFACLLFITFNKATTSNVLETENVTVLGTEVIYKLSDKYDFFIPNIRVNCECVCTEDKEKLQCSSETQRKHYACGILSNSTTRCTVYDNSGKDPRICSTYYRVCCQTYISKQQHLGIKSFTAFRINMDKVLFKIKFTSKHQKISNRTLYISSDIKYLLLDYNSFLYFQYGELVQILKSDWYFTEGNGGKLLFSENLNKKYEKNVRKIGWFHWDVYFNQLTTIPRTELKELLSIYLMNCTSNPPMFEWDLRTEFYTRNNVMFTPKYKIMIVSDVFKELISGLKLELEEESLKIQLRNPYPVRTAFSRNYAPFIFSSAIETFPDAPNYRLKITFVKGNGDFDVEITSPFWMTNHNFRISISEASLSQPFHSDHLLDVENYESSWICIYQGNQQLCNIPIILSVTDITESVPNTINKNCSHCHKENLVESSFEGMPFILGLITGIALILVLQFFIWWFCRRKQTGGRERGGRRDSKHSDENVEMGLLNNKETDETVEEVPLINTIKNTEREDSSTSQTPDSGENSVADDNEDSVQGKPVSDMGAKKQWNELSWLLSQNLTTQNSKRLFRLLDFKEADTDEIEFASIVSREGRGGFIRRALERWKQREGARATITKLTGALRSIQRVDLAETIFRDIRKTEEPGFDLEEVAEEIL